MELICRTKDELPAIAGEILGHLVASGTRVVTLTGDLGAGKTALVSEFCHLLGSVDAVSSPTFAIINEYLTEEESLIYHIDLYRMKDLTEALNVGIEDYLYSGQWCFIEWPGIVESIIHPPYAAVSIETEGESSRRFRILIHSSHPANG